MALFRISKGNEMNLPAQKREGFAYFTLDESDFYIDTESSTTDASGNIVGGKRQQLNAHRARYLKSKDVNQDKEHDLYIDDEEISLGRKAKESNYEDPYDGTVGKAGFRSIAVGSAASATGNYSSSFGTNTSAQGPSSHAEGKGVLADSEAAHAEGVDSQALAMAAHAEGVSTAAAGEGSHAEGYGSITDPSANYAHAEGYRTQANGEDAHSEGYETKANGMYSHSEGAMNTAEGDASHTEGVNTITGEEAIGAHAEGIMTIAIGPGAHSEGGNFIDGTLVTDPYTFPEEFTSDLGEITINSTVAAGEVSHAEGFFTLAYGPGSHTEGILNLAKGVASHAEGGSTLANGAGAHAEGEYSIAYGEVSHAEGQETLAEGDYSHSEGQSTTAKGTGAHSEGNDTTAQGDYSHAEGQSTSATGGMAHAEGSSTTSSGVATHAEGSSTTASGNSAHAEGKSGQATGNYSHVEGFDTRATKESSHAEGNKSQATGNYSHAQGNQTLASGESSNAEGQSTTAIGIASHAEGISSQSQGNYSHAEGNGSKSIGISSHAEGEGSEASGQGSHAEGYQSKSSGIYSHAEGAATQASGSNSHAEGSGSIASGFDAHAEGTSSKATLNAAHAEGFETQATNEYAHAEGKQTLASGKSSHAEGSETIASGQAAHAEGSNLHSDGTELAAVSIKDSAGTTHAIATTTAQGISSHAEGVQTLAKGYASHSEGFKNIAINSYAHAEGTGTKAEGAAAHSEGNTTIASGAGAHSEGSITTASGASSHAEGQNTTASGNYAHSEGYKTTASGADAHAEGNTTVASGADSHAQNLGTIASGAAQTALGKYNIADTSSAVIIGNGTSDSARSNIFTIDWNGNAFIAGKITQGTPSADATIINMNRMQKDLFVSGDGSAPNQPKVPGFYLGKSASDENRHMDIVSGADYAYIDFNKASVVEDYKTRLIVNVTTGLTQMLWGASATDKRFLIDGILEVMGATNLNNGLTLTRGHLYLSGANSTSSTANTTQIIFGTPSNNHVAISSNNNAIVINPTSTSTANQIVLYLDKQSVFPSGVQAGSLYVTGASILNGLVTANSGILSKAQIKVIDGTANDNSIYQFDNATYRNPDQHTPEMIINSSNASTGVIGYRPGLVIYNGQGNQNATVGLTFAFRETATAGNAVMGAAILSIKESAGTANAWSQAGLRFLTKNMGALTEAMAITNDGKVGIATTTPSYKLHVAGDIYANGGWFRVSGNNGYYFETHGGGWYMKDANYIRTHNNKKVIAGNSIYIGTTAGAGTGLSLYSESDPTTYGIHMSTTANYSRHGDVQSDWATYFNMNAVGQRGWIYRAGSTNVASISCNGIGTFAGVGNNSRYLAFPKGGEIQTNGSNGYLIIELPVLNTSTMIKFKVSIYNYVDDESCDYIISGYNYSDGSWYNPTAICLGKPNKAHSNLTVRYGQYNGHSAISIGEANTAWQYPNITISDVTLGHSGTEYYDEWSKGWRLLFSTTAISNITKTITGTHMAQVSGTINKVAKFTAVNTVGDSNITDDGSTVTIGTKLVVKGNGTSYNEGIRILPASNGWSNIFFSDDQSVSGQRATGWLVGRRGAAGSSAGAMGDFTIEVNGSSGTTGMTLTQAGALNNSGEIISRSANGFRIVQGNYGVFLRNDGSNTYFLLTASGDQYGTWNALRPFSINNATGAVTISNGLTVNGNATIKNLLTIGTGASHYGILAGQVYIASINQNLILQNLGALRFGGDSWDYNVWAGLKYDHGSKTIYLGLADNSIFTANVAQSGGTLALPAVRYFSINGKQVIDAGDAWLRINGTGAHSSGIYFGTSITRTDGQFQVGSGGSNFYANSAGEGFFKNTLRIGTVGTTSTLSGNYCEGIRINCPDSSWATIILGATAATGTNANAWSIHRKSDNNFCISRNSSDGVNGLVMTSTGMGLGIAAPTHRLHVVGTTFLNGLVTVQSGVYTDGYTGALNMNNSNIYGLNSIYTADLADSSSEGIHFYRTATTVDSLWAKNGVLYFTPNRTLGSAGTSQSILHTGVSGGMYYVAGNTSGTAGTWTGTNASIPSLYTGLTIAYKIGIAGASTTTLNLTTAAGASGAITVRRNAGNLTTHLPVGTVVHLTYDGTYWCWADYDSNTTYYKDSVEVTTAAATAAKVGSTSYYTLASNRYITVMIRYANTAASALTLNINSAGAKPIYINGSASSASNYTLPAGIYLVYYNGTNYYFRTDGVIQGGTFAGTASYASALNCRATTSDTKYYILGATGTGNQNVYRAYNASGTQNTTGVYFNGSTGVLYGAAWNDYAEFRSQHKEEIQAGYCVASTNDGKVYKTNSHLQACDGIVSDTYGFTIGETPEANIPLAVSGRVLAYCEGDRNSYQSGDTVGASKNGKVIKMTREEIKEYPDRIVGIVSEIPQYETWGANDNVKVNGRIWIKVK